MKPWPVPAGTGNHSDGVLHRQPFYLKSSLRQVDSSDGHVFHPIIYAFLREATAGPIMCAMAWFTSGETVFMGPALLHSLTAM